MHKQVAFIICLASLTVSSALASGNFYVELKGGISKPSRLKGDMDNFKIKGSPEFAISGGYNFNKYFAIDLSLAYHPSYKLSDSEVKPNYQTHNNGEIDRNVLEKAQIKSFVSMLTAYFNITDYNGFIPYVGLGGGFSYNKYTGTKVYSDYNGVTGNYHPNSYEYIHNIAGASATSFAWQAIAGVRAHVTDNIAVSFEYKYAKLGKIKSGNKKIRYDGYTTEVEIQKSTLGANNSFLLGVRYSF